MREEGLTEKGQIINFLNEKKWKLKKKINDRILIFEKPVTVPFAYFLNEENGVVDIKYKPGKIEFQVDVIKDDYLIVNQIYQKDWEHKTDIYPKYVPGVVFADFIQSYPLYKGTTEVTIKYNPTYWPYAIAATVVGIIILVALMIIKEIRKQ